jgi:acyl phosphate:glycerol-3-phosphate acyltransferase
MIDPMGGPGWWWPLLLGFLLAYLLGSIPSGFVLTRWAGLGDIRKIGSGNIGATNVLRTGRKGLAIATLVFDLLKGAIPTFIAWRWFGPDMAILAGAGAFLGHCFPVWLGVKGGKGVATAAGVILGFTPTVMAILLLAFIAVVALTRYVSLASILTAVFAPVVAWLLGEVQPAQLYLLLAVIVVVKHHANIARLLKGQESKVSMGGARS